MPPSTPAEIVLDVGDIDAETDFWASILDYRVVETINRGEYVETRRLESELAPALAIRLMLIWPRPPVGSWLGSLRAIRYRVADPAGVAAGARGARARTEKPSDAVEVITPNGYRVILDRA